eukprot:gene10564-11707_t
MSFSELAAETRRRRRRFVCLSADVYNFMPMELQALDGDHFKYFPIQWEKYADGTDNITISGFSPKNEIAGEHILFFASFHNNDVTLSQISVLIVLLQSFIESLTIVLPFYPVGTNERVEVEGKVATANTYATLLSNLPSIGRHIRIMIYDIHALQNRFYFHGSVCPSLHTSVPLLFRKMTTMGVQCACFPDEGAAKRFGKIFREAGWEVVVCGKIRDGDIRRVSVQDGDPKGKEVVIVDDLVQTGGTLYECAMALKAKGASQVYAFTAHAVFPNESWKAFSRQLGGNKAVFERFFVTNSMPIVTNALPKDDVFEVLDLLPQVLEDLDNFY